MNHNRTRYTKHGCRCDVCCRSNDEFNRWRREKRQAERSQVFKLKLDGTVFVERLIKDNRHGAINTSLISRWSRNGIDVYNADRWCVRLGYHPIEIWGQDFYAGCHND